MGERNSDICRNKRGKDLWWYTLGACWGVLAIDYTSCRPVARLFSRKGGEECVQAITRAT